MSKHKPLPCIENKCLLYPACRHKPNIRCEDLKVYMRRFAPIYPFSDPVTSTKEWAYHNETDSFLVHIRKTLPIIKSY